MYVLNFSHPFTAEQTAQVLGLLQERERDPERRAQVTVEEVIIRVQLDFTGEKTIPEQLIELIDGIDIPKEAVANGAYVVRMPALSEAVAFVQAELHGRSGHHPKMVMFRRADGGGFQAYAILDLQEVRDTARQRR